MGIQVRSQLAEKKPLTPGQVVRDPIYDQIAHQHVGAGTERCLAGSTGNDRDQPLETGAENLINTRCPNIYLI